MTVPKTYKHDRTIVTAVFKLRSWASEPSRRTP
jgi:hypothetical protein